jgi:hypothetical protein
MNLSTELKSFPVGLFFFTRGFVFYLEDEFSGLQVHYNDSRWPPLLILFSLFLDYIFCI